MVAADERHRHQRQQRHGEEDPGLLDQGERLEPLLDPGALAVVEVEGKTGQLVAGEGHLDALLEVVAESRVVARKAQHAVGARLQLAPAHLGLAEGRDVDSLALEILDGGAPGLARRRVGARFVRWHPGAQAQEPAPRSEQRAVAPLVGRSGARVELDLPRLHVTAQIAPPQLGRRTRRERLLETGLDRAVRAHPGDHVVGWRQLAQSREALERQRLGLALGDPPVAGGQRIGARQGPRQHRDRGERGDNPAEVGLPIHRVIPSHRRGWAAAGKAPSPALARGPSGGGYAGRRSRLQAAAGDRVRDSRRSRRRTRRSRPCWRPASGAPGRRSPASA